MDHKPGDFVIHPAYGVGQIMAVEEMEFVEKRQALFYRVGFGKTTIWVPVQMAHEKGIRTVTMKSDLPHYRDILESPPVSLDHDFHTRQIELEERLRDFSFQILCEVVRDLYALREIKTLNNYEKNLFTRTSRSLQEEWAVSSGVPIEETTRMINAMLQKGSPNLVSKG